MGGKLETIVDGLKFPNPLSSAAVLPAPMQRSCVRPSRPDGAESLRRPPVLQIQVSSMSNPATENFVVQVSDNIGFQNIELISMPPSKHGKTTIRKQRMPIRTVFSSGPLWNPMKKTDGKSSPAAVSRPVVTLWN